MAKPVPDAIEACVFDAYGTLFDVNSAARRAGDLLGNTWQPLAELWRAKQLQYTWLRSLMGRHADFAQVTRDALDFALASLNLHDPVMRERLLALYQELDAYPDVRDTLTQLRAAGQRLAILSNGTPEMLSSAVRHAGLGDLLDAVMSVEEAGIYKPHPSVYRIAVDRFKLPPARICFVSANAWDAQGAKAFGFRVVWCNRLRQPAERIPERPDHEIDSLAALPRLIGLD